MKNDRSAAVRPDTRRRLLAVLASETRVTRASLAERSGLGVMTVHRAAYQLIREGVLRAVKGSDPATGRTVNLLFPTLPVPALLVDPGTRGTRIPRALYLRDVQSPEEGLSIRRESGGLLTPEEDLRQLMADIRRSLPDRPAALCPVLLLPAGQSELTAARLSDVLHDELTAAGIAVTGRVITADASEAALLALTRLPAAQGRTSLLSVGPDGCRLLVRASDKDAWFCPPAAAPLTDALFGALTSPGGPDREQAARLLGLCAPEAVTAELGGAVTEDCAALLRACLPSAPLTVCRTPLSLTGAWMTARLSVWG